MNIKKENIPLIAFISFVTAFTLWQARKVVLMSKRYLNIKEVGVNMGWDNPNFMEKMIAVGWKSGYQWCVYFVKAMWADAYPELKVKEHKGKTLLNYISGNSQNTYDTFSRLQYETGLFTIRDTPKVGDIVIWRNYDSNGNPKTSGHAGIVTLIKGEVFNTIEGNANNQVMKKIHNLDEYYKKTGSRLRGFIHYNYA